MVNYDIALGSVTLTKLSPSPPDTVEMKQTEIIRIPHYFVIGLSGLLFNSTIFIGFCFASWE